MLILRCLNILIINNSNCHTSKGKSSLTSLVACFILGKVNCRTYGRWYACGLKENVNKGLFYSCFGQTHPGKTKKQKPTQALKNATK